jgi:hypothetical protein
MKYNPGRCADKFRLIGSEAALKSVLDVNKRMPFDENNSIVIGSSERAERIMEALLRG